MIGDPAVFTEKKKRELGRGDSLDAFSPHGHQVQSLLLCKRSITDCRYAEMLLLNLTQSFQASPDGLGSARQMVQMSATDLQLVLTRT